MSTQSGKTIIVTGANGNLGTAVTRTFLSKGYKVIATVSNEAAKKDFQHAGNLQVAAVDLTDEAAADAFVQNTIAQHTQIAGALLLVGGFAMGAIATTTLNDVKKQISLNFDTAYNVARPLWAQLKKQGTGQLVFVGARPALDAASGKELIAYGLSKSLLFKLAEYLNEEAKGTNITATVVVPSTLDTSLNRQHMPNANPNNWVQPEALADILEFIISDRAAPLRETVLKVYNNA